MEIKKITDDLAESNCYIIREGQSSIIIDPNCVELIDSYLEQENLEPDYIILTHEHYDHIYGVNSLYEKYKPLLVASFPCAEAVCDTKLNMSRNFEVYLYFLGKERKEKIPKYICRNVDIKFQNCMEIAWKGHCIELQEAPGHSRGSILITLDKACLFSGDSLLEGETITRFRGGSTQEYENITIPLLKTFSGDMQVLPGHGQAFGLGSRLMKQIKE